MRQAPFSLQASWWHTCPPPPCRLAAGAGAGGGCPQLLLAHCHRLLPHSLCSLRCDCSMLCIAPTALRGCLALQPTAPDASTPFPPEFGNQAALLALPPDKQFHFLHGSVYLPLDAVAGRHKVGCGCCTAQGGAAPRAGATGIHPFLSAGQCRRTTGVAPSSFLPTTHQPHPLPGVQGAWRPSGLHAVDQRGGSRRPARRHAAALRPRAAARAGPGESSRSVGPVDARVDERLHTMRPLAFAWEPAGGSRTPAQQQGCSGARRHPTGIPQVRLPCGRPLGVKMALSSGTITSGLLGSVSLTYQVGWGGDWARLGAAPAAGAARGYQGGA